MNRQCVAAARLGAVVRAAVCVFCSTTLAAAAEQPADKQLVEEIHRAHQWAEAAFAEPGTTGPPPVTPHPVCALTVLHKSHKVLTNRTVWNTPLKLADKQYEHGIFMDAPAAVRVRLAQPAVELTATVGIDNNQDTQSNPDSGSARFHVSVGGKRVFSTPVLRVQSDPVRVKMSLDRAEEFVLEVDDGGNGRSHDQCTWADAAVKLDDGSVRFLDEGVFCPWRPNSSTAPFSFTYGGVPSGELLPDWEYSAKTEQAADVIRRVVSYQDPKTGLLLECHVTTYNGDAGVDWVFYLRNTGKEDTPIIEQFLPLDTEDVLGAELPKGSVTLRWSNGDGCTAVSFLPHDEVLQPDRSRQFQARSSDTSCFPFFNLKGPDGGWILAVGWTGGWTAGFLHREGGQLAVRAGMQATHFRLKPGERVRTPRILMLRYLDDEMIDGHNRFRRLMLKHYVQRRDGLPAEPPVACNNTAGLWYRAQRDKKPLGRLSEATELASIPRIARFGCEAYWMDAYWYPQPWGRNEGNWYPRPEDFPRGLRPLSDAAHRHDMKFVLWFAPFFVRDNTKWAREYPQHIHGGGDGRGGVWKAGDPVARQFLTDFISGRVDEWGIDVYREDFGIGNPPEEGPDRIGIAEMQHVEGFYRFWSDLLRRHPGLLIDNCCGGGRRIDLEANSRAFTLWRSDYNDIGQGLKGEANWPLMAQADQVMVTGLSLYVPFHTGPIWTAEPYCFRSATAAGIVLYNDLDGPWFPEEKVRGAIAELKELRPLFQGNIYPLMPLTASQADWYAYQLDRPDLRRGCAFVFRRPEAADRTRQISLRKIDPAATYRLSITGETYAPAAAKEISGRDLLQTKVQIDSKPGSVLLRYERRTP